MLFRSTLGRQAQRVHRQLVDVWRRLLVAHLVAAGDHVEQLQPAWVVLRRRELGAVGADYEEVHVVRATPEQIRRLNEPMPIPTIDDEFHIFRRKDDRR